MAFTTVLVGYKDSKHPLAELQPIPAKRLKSPRNGKSLGLNGLDDGDDFGRILGLRELSG